MLIIKLLIPKKLRGRKKKAQLVAKYDQLFPKFSKKIILVVKKNTEFSGNLRVCADLLLKYRRHKLYVYKDGDMPLDIQESLKNQGVKVLEPNLWSTFYHILTAGVFVLSHVPRDAHLSVKHKSRKVIGLWHGVAFKNIESQMLFVSDSKMELIKQNAELYDLMTASSEADKNYIIKSFLVDDQIVKITGLPRYELLKQNYPFDQLILSQRNRLSNIKGNQRLLVYAPTFRENAESAFNTITDEEWFLLSRLLEKNNAVLGLRPHPYDNKEAPNVTKEMRNIYWLSQEDFTETNVLLQLTNILIVDFSSIWIDYLLLDRPIVGFAKDFEHYKSAERGFAYDFDDTFPDKFTHNISDLIQWLNKMLGNNNITKTYESQKELFHKHGIGTDFTKNLESSLEQLGIL
ncbi:CDP-glycerol glycerophosphotransferase family protein [Psychrobacter celer]|uniref:CDP-glycerol glycerophosphotransferase family protein n=1 Tax=Psychrobacter celer TaxID=306572 RepID=UPI003FD5DFF8